MEILNFSEPVVPGFLVELFGSAQILLGNNESQFWSSDAVSHAVFFPIVGERGTNLRPGQHDGLVVVDPDEGVGVSFRFFSHPTPRAVMLYFHANAEVAWETEAQPLLDMDIAVFAVDYRGYGWGTGQPSLATLCSDAEKCAERLDALLAERGLQQTPVVLFGRSIGATCAVHLATAQHNQKRFSGLVLESPLVKLKDLPAVRAVSENIPSFTHVFAQLAEPLRTMEKLANVDIPLLVFHGARDKLVPLRHAKDCYLAARSRKKRLEVFEQATHNDVIAVDPERYDRVMFGFVDHVCHANRRRSTFRGSEADFDQLDDAE